jgi:restriction system protein
VASVILATVVCAAWLIYGALHRKPPQSGGRVPTTGGGGRASRVTVTLDDSAGRLPAPETAARASADVKSRDAAMRALADLERVSQSPRFGERPQSRAAVGAGGRPRWCPNETDRPAHRCAPRGRDSRPIDRLEALLDRQRTELDTFVRNAARRYNARDEYGYPDRPAINREFFRFLRGLREVDRELRGEWDARLHRADEQTGVDPEKLAKDKDLPLLSGIAARAWDRLQERLSDAGADSEEARVSALRGEAFEQYLMDRLRAAGATAVRGTPKTRDHGADVTFTYEGIRVAVQAKGYAGSVGNDAVQQAYAGRAMYDCDVAWVVTNSTFTAAAREQAAKLGVTLVDGSRLDRLRDELRRVRRPAE